MSRILKWHTIDTYMNNNDEINALIKKQVSQSSDLLSTTDISPFLMRKNELTIHNIKYMLHN